MRLTIRATSALTLLALLGAACQDLPTTPAAAPLLPAAALSAPSGLSFNRSAASSSATPYQCYTSVRTPEGPYRYRYGRIALHFPEHALASDGATRLYLYRVQDEGQEPQRVINCRIPATREAVELMHRRFHVDKDARISARGKNTGDVSTQDFALDQLVVTVRGCSDPDMTRGEDGVCRSSPGGGALRGDDGGDPGTGPGGGSGGGTMPDPGIPPEDAYSEGPGVFATCVGTMMLAAVPIAALQFTMSELYAAAGALSAAERMLQAVRENNAEHAVILQLQYERDQAQLRYNSAKTYVAIAGGASATLVGAAVVACSPTLLLPTP